MKVIVFCFLVFLSNTFAQEYQCRINSEGTFYGKIFADVEKIISQEEVKYNTTVSPKLYLVSNNQILFFGSLQNEPTEFEKYVGDKSFKLKQLKFRFNDALTIGFLIVQLDYENEEKWHTINIEKNEDDKWEIVGWHISS